MKTFVEVRKSIEIFRQRAVGAMKLGDKELSIKLYNEMKVLIHHYAETIHLERAFFVEALQEKSVASHIEKLDELKSFLGESLVDTHDEMLTVWRSIQN